MMNCHHKALTSVLSALLVLEGLGIAEAGVPQRQQRQQNRIYQGVRSGALTRREFKGLEKEQFHIQRDKQKAWSDGNLTNREQARLQRELNRSSRDIYRQKHDNQNRP